MTDEGSARQGFNQMKQLRQTKPSASDPQPTEPDYKRWSIVLWRSLGRLSSAIEACARIGFEESSPTMNEHHASIWDDLNAAQKDAKLKLDHFLVQQESQDD